MVGDYLDIVHIIMRDQAPKYIMFSLVQALQVYLEEDMVDDLLKCHPAKKDRDELMQRGNPSSPGGCRQVPTVWSDSQRQIKLGGHNQDNKDAETFSSRCLE